MINLEVLLWLLPTGWVVSVVQWFINRKRLRTLAYKESNDDVLSVGRACREEINNVHIEIFNLYEKLRIYNQAMAAAGTCGNDNDCPVISKLQEQGICHRFGLQNQSVGNRPTEGQQEIG